jgi:hypothetical protein
MTPSSFENKIVHASPCYEFGSNRMTVSEGGSNGRCAVVRYAHSDVVPLSEDFSISFAADPNLNASR